MLWVRPASTRSDDGLLDIPGTLHYKGSSARRIQVTHSGINKTLPIKRRPPPYRPKGRLLWMWKRVFGGRHHLSVVEREAVTPVTSSVLLRRQL